jgi:hypothetical protein
MRKWYGQEERQLPKDGGEEEEPKDEVRHQWTKQ